MTLVFGDSHSNMFAGVAGVIHRHSPEAVTARRIADPEFQPIWSGLNLWLLQHQGAPALVLSVSEVDIRAHFWRHLPRAVTAGKSVDDFLASLAQELLQGLLRIQQKYSIGRIVLWTAPPATANTTYNPAWPFVGCVSTRNVLIHLFNCEIQRQIASDPSIFLATGFYDYIDPVRYLPRDHIPSDGVHWHDSLRDQLWNHHIAPAIAGHTVDLGDSYRIMAQHRPSFVENVVKPGCLYDTWVRTEDLALTLDTDPRARVLGCDYSRINLQDRARFPDSYRELALINQ